MVVTRMHAICGDNLNKGMKLEKVSARLHWQGSGPQLTSLSMKVTAWKLVQGLATGTWTHDSHGMHHGRLHYYSTSLDY